jgi:hypothetical protein
MQNPIFDRTFEVTTSAIFGGRVDLTIGYGHRTIAVPAEQAEHLRSVIQGWLAEQCKCGYRGAQQDVAEAIGLRGL